MSTTGIRAGRAFVVIGIDDKVTAALSRIQKQVRGFADSVGGIGRTLAGVGAAIATPLGLATASFASFDDAMRAVQGVTGSNAAQLESLTAVAAELGRTTSFTSTEVASLMTELGRAGFNPKQIEDATSSVLALSRATGTDAAISAGIMAATLRQFSMDASEAARVSDVLAATANKTFNSVESLGEALSYAGPVAKQLGMSIEDTSAMLGMLGNVGIQGSAAGTALRRMGIIAASSGDQLREAFDVSNIDAAGNMRPLVDIIGDIGRSIQSLPVTEQVEKMEQVFGLLGITSATKLAESAASVSDLADVLRDANGTAQQTAETMDAGIGGAFRRAASAADGLVNQIGRSLEGPIQNLSEAFSRATSSLTEYVASNPSLVSAVALASATLVSAGVALIGIGLAARVAAAAIAGTQVVFSAAAAGIGLVVSAAKALRVALLLAQATQTLVAGGTAAMSAAMGMFYAAETAAAGGGVIASSVFSILGSILTALAAPLAAGSGLFGALGVAASSAAAAAAAAWTTTFAPLLPLVAVVVAAMAAIAGGIALLGGVVAYALYETGALSSMFGILKSTAGELAGIFSKTFGVILKALSSGQYATAAKALWAGIKGTFFVALKGLIDAMLSAAHHALAVLGSMTTSLFRLMVSLASRLGGLIVSVMVKGVSSIPAMLTSLFSEGLGGVYRMVSDGAAAANAELDSLQQSLAATEASAASLAQQRQELAQQAAAAQDAANRARFGNDAVDLANFKSAGASQEEVAKFKATQAAKAAAELDKSIQERVASLQKETVAIRSGAKAAELMKLASDGATRAQLQQVAAANAAKQAAQLQSDIRDRIADLQKERIEMRLGSEAAERYALSLKGATQGQLDALKVAQQQVAGDRRRQDMEAEGERLREQLRTPLEVFRDEIANIRQLMAGGVIDETTAQRAVARAREALAQGQGAIGRQVTQRAGEGKFDGFALAKAVGKLDGDDEKRTADAAERIDENTREMVNAFRNQPRSRFGI